MTKKHKNKKNNDVIMSYILATYLEQGIPLEKAYFAPSLMGNYKREPG